MFGKRYFEKVFSKEDPWRYFICEYERRKYIRQIEAIKRHVPHPERILEIGCAEGAHTLMLAKAFPEASIVGVEISETAARRAIQNCSGYPNVNILEADIIGLFKQAYFPENSFDVVIQSETLYYLFPTLVMQLKVVPYLRGVTKIMKKNGIFVTSNQYSIRTWLAMATYYWLLKRLCRLAHDSEYREWNDTGRKYVVYDLKVFMKGIEKGSS